MTVQQIVRKKCTVFGQSIYLDPNVLSSFGNKVPLNENGTRHHSFHTYIHRKALELRLRREYLESIESISIELEQKEEQY